jgi:hypothetical protein
MFVGFVAVIVVILIIIAIMSSGDSGKEDGAKYITEAQKVKVLMSTIKAEAQFYYSGHGESFKGISFDYFKDIAKLGKGSPDSFGNEVMKSEEWLGVDTTDPENTTSTPFFRLGGSAGDNMRLIIAPIASNLGFTVKIVGKDADQDGNVDGVPKQFLTILEKVMSEDSEYLGG